MPEVKNCLTCRWEPEWNNIKPEDNDGIPCGIAESCCAPAISLPENIRRDCLVRFLPDENDYSGSIFTGGEYGESMEAIEVIDCPAHQPKEEKMTGIERIVQERARQVEKEGWTDEHDAQHQEGQLAWAALYYAMPYPIRHKCHCGAASFTTPDSMFDKTDWDAQWAKRDTKNRIQQLAAAGALIAAEIDRLQAAKENQS